MSDNVISLGTRKTLEEDRAELARAEEVHKTNLDETAKLHRSNMLTFLDRVRERVEAGELDGMVVVGRNPNNGAFLASSVLNDLETRVDTYLAYAGMMGAMQLDLTDLANAGPHMNSDGTFMAFGTVQEIETEGEE